MLNLRVVVATIALLLLAVAPVLAADTSKIYTSGLLVLLFVGFCALLIVVQLLPAILSVMGMTKNAAQRSVEQHMRSVSVKKH